jgi:hypothetical protein
VQYLFFTAVKGASVHESVKEFLAALRESGLPADANLVPGAGALQSWLEAFRALALVLPDTPSVVVLDELPWLAEQDDHFDGSLQVSWDRLLASKPVLLLMLGSDVHMMERLTGYDRPFFGRADSLVLGPLSVLETARALGLDPGDAIDAHLITGGLPGIMQSWPHGTPPMEFLRRECGDPAAPVFGVPESALLAEFPAPDNSRRVLEAIGAGHRTHANVAAAVGGDVAFALMERRWPSWRGLAVEPLVRESLQLACAAGATPWPEAEAVGGWWNRQFDPEVDLIGADRSPVAGRIYFAGSIKWLGTPFDRHDLADLAWAAAAVPGYDYGATGLVVVSLAGRSPAVGSSEAQFWWEPEDVVSAWRA